MTVLKFQPKKDPTDFRFRWLSWQLLVSEAATNLNPFPIPPLMYLFKSSVMVHGMSIWVTRADLEERKQSLPSWTTVQSRNSFSLNKLTLTQLAHTLQRVKMITCVAILAELKSFRRENNEKMTTMTSIITSLEYSVEKMGEGLTHAEEGKEFILHYSTILEL